MALKCLRTMEVLLMTALIMPCGMLLASESNQPAAKASNSANWYDVEQASNIFNQMDTHAHRVRRAVARLQAQGYELNWREHSRRLGMAKDHINAIAGELKNLDQMESRLEPWQQRLVDRVTPNVHEMVYQTNAALNTLNNHLDPHTLRLTEYPNYIDQIYQNANQMVNTIHSIRQSAHRENMASLAVRGTNPGS